MPIKVYKMDFSPPARAVMMTCEIYGVPMDLIDVNLTKGDHHKPEFLKLNPVRSIPVIEDGDVVLHDSHPILMYIADIYGKNDSLYPKDPVQRAYVNQKLFFNSSILFPRLRNIAYPLLRFGISKVPDKKITDIVEAYGMLEEFLSRSKYLAGDNITLADVAAIATVTSLADMKPIDGNVFPKTQAWIDDITEKSYCKKYNAPGAAIFSDIVTKRLEF